MTLGVGDRLYLYSDGLTEAMDQEGKCFGEERVLPALEQSHCLPLESSLIALAQRVEQWSGPMVSRDDTSILAIEFVGAVADHPTRSGAGGSCMMGDNGRERPKPLRQVT